MIDTTPKVMDQMPPSGSGMFGDFPGLDDGGFDDLALNDDGGYDDIGDIGMNNGGDMGGLGGMGGPADDNFGPLFDLDDGMQPGVQNEFG